MKCHYDVLELPKDSTTEDLKKAYRKLALKWHPDKNPDNIDEAKREFILVQQAYEVLIDPQERAWYDRHRDSILKGAGSGYEDESLDVFPYFSASCYRGYDDSNNSFYTIYREVFNKLAAEESEYLAEDDMDPPEFGKSDSSYDIVSKFYGYWSSFCTKKTYSWLNTYDINDAENRRILRLMEQENKKVRERAKKERNDEIRALVQFVRKRDKRVQQYAEYLKQKTAENNKKAEEHRKKMIAEHHKNVASYKESDWSKFSNLEKELKEIESTIANEFNDQSDDSDNDDLFCVACNKYFKTEKSFANHEKSKKHKENAALLKNSMIEEEDLVNGAGSDSDNVEEIDIDGEKNEVPDVESADELHSEEQPQEKNKSKKNKNKKKSRKVSSEDEGPIVSPVRESESLDELPSEEELPKKKSKSKKNKNKKKSRKESSEDEDLINSTELASPDELISEEEEAPTKKSKKNKNKKQVQKVISEDDEPFDLAELGGSKKQRKKLEREKILLQKQNPPNPPIAEPIEEASDTTKSNKKKGKKKKEPEVQPPEKHEKVEKNSKVVKNSDTKNKNKPTNGHDILELDLNHECATCKESFDSKNKLFQHLTTSGHSILLPSKGKNSKAKKKK